MTFEEFKDKFVEHIEGRAVNDRQVVGDSDDDDDHKSQKSKKGKKTVTEGQTEQDEGDQVDPSAASHQSKEKTASQHKSTVSLSKKTDTTYKFEIPEACHINLLKNSKIEKLREKYLLLVHPFPIIEGEMLILQPKKEDQKERDLIVYRDYSLRKRLATKEKASKDDFFTRKEKGEQSSVSDENVSKLQCLEIDLEQPLATVEWKNMAEVVNEVMGLSWFQILPVGQKSSQPLQFNAVHILPNSKLPFAQLPLDVMWSGSRSYGRKLERQSGPTNVNELTAQLSMNRADMEDLARQQGMVMLPEFDFEHVIYNFSEPL